MIKIAVCDDNLENREEIASFVHSFFHEKQIQAEIRSYPDAESLLKDLKAYDIYLLDIHMPQLNGIELAKKIRMNDPKCSIIFLTASPEYALEAFQVDALQYLLKPLNLKTLERALEKAAALKAAFSKMNLISVPTPKGAISVALDELEYVEHLNKVLHFHLADGTVVRSSNSSLTISQLSAAILLHRNFICPHRAFLVNLNYISVFSAASIQMVCGSQIPVSRNNIKEMKARYTQWLTSTV